MKTLTILGIFALFLLLVIPGAVSAADVTVSGSIAQPAPVADFTVTATNGLVPITVSFTDASTVTIGTIDTWNWEYRIADNGAWTEFGSGVQNLTDIVFSNPGTYDIRLTVSNSGGSDTKTKTHVFSAAKASDPLVTVASGVVSGDLYMHSVSPFTATATQTFTLPAEAVGNVQWAQLYVNTYSGSYTSDRRGTSVVTLDGTTLGTETLDVWQGFPTGSGDPDYSVKGKYAYPLNQRVMKVMSDYEAVYDVTSLITTATPTVTVTNSPISGYEFDGRIKGITLLVAYNDGDSDQVKYIVNHGNDWMGPAGQTGSTTFDASAFGSGWADATVRSVAHSSTDGAYTFNAVTPAKTTLLSGTYIKWNSFDVKSLLNSGSNTFAYTAGGSSFKICTAALTATYTAPTATFTATPLSGDAPLTVAFTDASTGGPTSWAWDFNNDGTTDSTAQSPSYTYNTPGIYTVKLTVSNAFGTDDETKTNYVTVKTPAPTADFTYTPASGAAPLNVAFTDTSSGVVNSYAWDFNNDGTTDSTLQNPSYEYAAPGIYSVKLVVNGPDYSDEELKTNIISVGIPTISVDVSPASVSFGQMVIGDNTGSTSVAVTTDGGNAWSVTAAANNGGYMKDNTKTLAQAFQLANGGGAFQAMTSPFNGFMSGTADEDKTNTANVKQVRESGDQPGSYSIQLTFTGSFV